MYNTILEDLRSVRVHFHLFALKMHVCMHSRRGCGVDHVAALTRGDWALISITQYELLLPRLCQAPVIEPQRVHRR